MVALSVAEEDQEPSPEQVQILGLVAHFGQMTRSLIEHYRREDSASLLERMVKRGLLAKIRSDRGVGSPNVCRVTAKALHVAGDPIVEAMKATIDPTGCPSYIAHHSALAGRSDRLFSDQRRYRPHPPGLPGPPPRRHQPGDPVVGGRLRRWQGDRRRVLGPRPGGRGRLRVSPAPAPDLLSLPPPPGWPGSPRPAIYQGLAVVETAAPH